MKRLAFRSLIALGPMIGLCHASNLELIPRVILKHQEADGVGYRGGYSTLESMFAFQLGERHIPFIDARWHVMNRGKMSVNAGVGYRYDVAGSGVLLGGSCYYDQRGTTGQSFQQVTGGFEVLSRYLDFRANGYFPVGTKQEVRSAKFVDFVGSSMMIKVRDRIALTGCDGEFGSYLGGGEALKFYGALGGYFFKRSECNTKFGFKSRLKGSWRDNISAEVAVFHDDLFHTNVQGTLALNFPFWPKQAQKRLTKTSGWNYFPYRQAQVAQPVVRQELIALCDANRFFPANSAQGQQIVVIFVDNTSGSDGTIEDPYPRLKTAQEKSKPGDIIYVFPGDGTDRGYDEGIELKSGQKLLGSHASHKIATSVGSVRVPSRTNQRPKISNRSGPCVVLADNTVVSSIDIENSDGYGILGVDVQNVVIDDVSISQTQTHGFILYTENENRETSINITNCDFSDNTGHGFCAYATNQAEMNVHLADCVLDRNLEKGAIFLGDSASALSGSLTRCSVSGNEVGIDLHGGSTGFDFKIHQCVSSNNLVGPGLHIDADDHMEGAIEVLDSTFSDNQDDGIEIIADHESNFTTLIQNCIVMRNAGDGIDIESWNNSSAKVSIFNNQLEANAAHGLDMVAQNNSLLDLHIEANSMVLDGISGIEFDGQGSSQCVGLVKNNLVQGARGSGIRVEMKGKATFEVTLENNQVQGVGGHGIELFSEDNSGFTGVITNNEIFNCQRYGILISSKDDASLTLSANGNLIDDVMDGLDFLVTHAASINAQVSNNTITNTMGYGIDLETANIGNLVVSVTDNTIDEALFHGVEFLVDDASVVDAIFSGNTISNISNNGFDIDVVVNSNAEITLSNNTITKCGNAGIDIYGSGNQVTADITMDGNTIEDSNIGITVNGFGERVYNMTVTNNSVLNNRLWGLYIYSVTNLSCTSTITNNRFNGHGYFGMLNYIGGTSTHVANIEGNEFSDNNFYGLYLYNFNQTTGNKITLLDNAFDRNNYYGLFAMHYNTPGTVMKVANNQANDNSFVGMFIRDWTDATLCLTLLDNTSNTGYFIDRQNSATLNMESPEPLSKASVQARNKGLPFTVSSGTNYVPLGTCSSL